MVQYILTWILYVTYSNKMSISHDFALYKLITYVLLVNN